MLKKALREDSLEHYTASTTSFNSYQIPLRNPPPVKRKGDAARTDGAAFSAPIRSSDSARPDGSGGSHDPHGAGGRRRAWSTPLGHDPRQLSDKQLQEQLSRQKGDEVEKAPKDNPLVVLLLSGLCVCPLVVLLLSGLCVCPLVVLLLSGLCVCPCVRS